MIIPFFIPHSGCPHQCVFCNQNRITGRAGPFDPADIPHIIGDYVGSRSQRGPYQIAFYGGSFTALSQEVQSAYLDALRPFVQTGLIDGIRLSTRPDCITQENLAFLKERHVKTVELGAQSMDDNVLRLSGRGHTASDTVRGVRLLKDFGFLVGLQLMPGLPGDFPGLFLETVEQVITLRPDFIRIYPALVIQNTPLEFLYRSGRYLPLTLDGAVSLCRDALLRLRAADIDVIRIGLQPTNELAQPGTVLAGPYHPAFRHLVESSVLLDEMRSALRDGKENAEIAVFMVHPQDLSFAIGQRRSNVDMLKQEFGMRKILFVKSLAVLKRGGATLLSGV